MCFFCLRLLGIAVPGNDWRTFSLFSSRVANLVMPIQELSVRRNRESSASREGRLRYSSHLIDPGTFDVYCLVMAAYCEMQTAPIKGGTE